MTISAIFINLQASNTWAVATVTVSAACSITTLPGTRTPFAPIHPADRHGTTGRATDQFLFRRTNTVHAHVVWVAVYTRSVSTYPTASTTCNVALAPRWPSRPVAIHWAWGRTTSQFLFIVSDTVHTHIVWVAVYTSSISADPTASTTCNVALAPFWPRRPVAIHWTWGRTTDESSSDRPIQSKPMLFWSLYIHVLFLLIRPLPPHVTLHSLHSDQVDQ